MLPKLCSRIDSAQNLIDHELDENMKINCKFTNNSIQSTQEKLIGTRGKQSTQNYLLQNREINHTFDYCQSI